MKRLALKLKVALMFLLLAAFAPCGAACGPTIVRVPVEVPVRDGGPGCEVGTTGHYGMVPASCDTVVRFTADVMHRFAEYTGEACDPQAALRVFWLDGPIDPWEKLAGVYYPLLGMMVVRTDLDSPGYSWRDIYQHEMGHHCLGQIRPEWGGAEDHCWMAWSGFMPETAPAADALECMALGLWPPPGSPTAAD